MSKPGRPSLLRKLQVLCALLSCSNLRHIFSNGAGMIKTMMLAACLCTCNGTVKALKACSLQVNYFKDKADYAISQTDSAFKGTVGGAPYPSDA